LRRLAPIALLVALVPAASASPSTASVTIGQVAPAPPPATCTTNAVDEAQATVISGNPYVVPGTGTITSWSHRAANATGQELTMKIFRKVAEPSTYAAVGHDGPRGLARGDLNTFPASIAVKPGDVLGINLASPVATGCGFAVIGETFLFRDGSLADGESGAFNINSSESTRLNVSAVFTYSNAFTLSQPKLNKRKGTATLTAEVPNPGVLALSGKGVKTAGAAGAHLAKSVPAGAVKLLVKPKGKSKRKLNETGTLKVKISVVYTPTAGDPNTQTKRLKLKKRGA
jgi:hypothetical protein